MGDRGRSAARPPGRATTTLDVGLGVREVLAGPATGQVVSVHRVAAYLRFPAGLIALTSGLAPSGPLHLRVAVLPGLHVGERVVVEGPALSGPTWSRSLDAPTWTGSLPPHPPAGGRTPGRGVRALRDLAARLGGRGPGLTPEGDDVLAGALLATRAVAGPSVEPELREIAASVRTTEVAAAFLAWAARGQCIAPAHDRLTATDDHARRSAERRLRAIGASSGAALLRGLRWGLRWGSGQASGTDNQIALLGSAPEFDQLCGRSVG
ncbi:hypothetical protein GCM10017691_32980 [Pseudonocardia petroleophila]|uniref:DUF2877 domain-containing protein n=1 Tax=Pseudonocardia petroleophila TaxID=37331 RepID=A0A7G7MDN0_9PSEU|nr:DUF2877 domain-containing protein [Pseudonocardia petroleophila]QNG50891.1 DUF2877 domain-containing protein [Pseudonocardia petroleophila]